MSFWEDLFKQNRMIVGLSPMDGVTDVVMRYMTARYGSRNNQISNSNNQTSGVDILFTEFVSVDALKHAKEEKSVGRVMQAFLRARDIGMAKSSDHSLAQGSELERQWPYEIAQVFGHTPELFYQAAVIVATLGYDGMDINMGCPAHKVEEQGSGAGLIRTPEIAKEIVRQSKQGMVDWAEGKVNIDDLEVSEEIKKWVHKNKPLNQSTIKPLPVSVKTRIGVREDEVESWMEHLMEVEPANISLHGRTLKQMYQGSADWDSIARAAAVVHKHGGHLLGNGDITSIEDLRFKIQQYGVDGGLIGRAAEGNPGIFLQGSVPCKICGAQGTEPCMHKRIAWMREHLKIFERVNKPTIKLDNGDVRWFMPIRKHLAWYCKGFEGAGEMRTKLVQASSVSEVEEILQEINK